MPEFRNIVVLGASFAGLQATHYMAKHILPTLKSKDRDVHYHLYVVSPEADWYFRCAAPRVATSTSLLAPEKVFAPFAEVFKNYKQEDFTFIRGSATGLDTASRRVAYKTHEGQNSELQYHALIVATGSRTHHPAFSSWGDKEETLAAIKSTNSIVANAKSVVIVGGGATGVETAGELGDYLNGKPGWFSSPQRKVSITILTAAKQLLPTIRSDIGKEAERKLKALGVDVQYNTRVTATDIGNDGKTTVTLGDGRQLTTDLYIAAHGVTPNSSWIPQDLLDERDYLKTNSQTLRVDLAGPRVYAFGDVSDYSRNTILDIAAALPVLATNVKRDLLAYDPEQPERAAPGKDRIYTAETKDMMIAPIGTSTGVGVMMGWKVPGWFVWLLKGRDYFLGFSFGPIVTGSGVKEVKWTQEEMVPF